MVRVGCDRANMYQTFEGPMAAQSLSRTLQQPSRTLVTPLSGNLPCKINEQGLL